MNAWYSLVNLEIILVTFVDNFVSRIFDFGWSVTLKNRGRSKKTEERTRRKSKGGTGSFGSGYLPSNRQQYPKFKIKFLFLEN